MRSRFSLNRGAAAACAVAGAATLLSGNCSAQTFIAADYATNSTYAEGWSAGQNGGYGFGPWSMDNTEITAPIEAAMDRTSPYNPFGVAWTLYNPEGSAPGPNPLWPGTQCVNGDTGTDISRAGRAFPSGGLQPGQTFSTVISNPTDRKFYRGYTIVFSTGTNNIDYYKVGDQIDVGTFEYYVDGRWYTSESYNSGRTTLFDTDTTTNGMQLDITMTGTNTYHLVMTPLENPGIAWAENGTLATNGLINWVTYQLYNTDSNFYPTNSDCGPDRTDFYIKSMTIQPLTLNIQKAGTDVLLSWPGILTNFALMSTTNLGAPGWNPVSPLPSVVNGQNVVTNSIPGTTQQFYRLQFQP